MKPGYKQTEIGLIPEDWDISQFGEKVKIYRGGSPRPIQDYLTDADTGVNWIKIGDVPPDGKYVRATEKNTPRRSIKIKRSSCWRFYSVKFNELRSPVYSRN